MERIRQSDSVATAAISRLGVALLVSAAAHIVLLARIETAPQRAIAPSVVQARIVSPPQPAPQRTPGAKTPEHRVPYVTADESAAIPSQPQPIEAVQALPPADPTIAAPIDLNYYSARELDVYPMPLQRIEVQAPPQADRYDGRVQVLALIDETGRVTDAKVFDAEPAHTFDATAVDAIRGARFAPARKEGRQVRSRVLIELEFAAHPD